MVGRVPRSAAQRVGLRSHGSNPQHGGRGGGAMQEAMVEALDATLLGSIADFCRRTGMAESTFGRRAVNDGKFVARLRDGARITPETLARVSSSLARPGD